MGPCLQVLDDVGSAGEPLRLLWRGGVPLAGMRWALAAIGSSSISIAADFDGLQSQIQFKHEG